MIVLTETYVCDMKRKWHSTVPNAHILLVAYCWTYQSNSVIHIYSCIVQLHIYGSLDWETIGSEDNDGN